VTPLVAIPREAVRARRRPRVVVLLWAWEATLGLVLGTAVASVASQAYGQHPRGDLPLFADGGLPLLDLLVHAAPARGPLLAWVVMVALVARIGGLVPSGAALADLALRAPKGAPGTLVDVVARGLRALPASLAAALLALLVQAATFACGLAFAAAATGATASLGEASADKAGLVVLALTTVPIVMTGVALDLTRAAVVRDDARALEAIESGLACLRARPVALTASYSLRALAALAPAALVATATARMHETTTASVVAFAVLHQAVIASRVAIRASWLARVLRATA